MGQRSMLFTLYDKIIRCTLSSFLSSTIWSWMMWCVIPRLPNNISWKFFNIYEYWWMEPFLILLIRFSFVTASDLLFCFIFSIYACFSTMWYLRLTHISFSLTAYAKHKPLRMWIESDGGSKQGKFHWQNILHGVIAETVG